MITQEGTPSSPAPQFTDMPAEIIKAVIGVMGEIGVIQQNSYNTHNDYHYASVDAFLAATNPVCAKHGLIVLPIQIGAERETIEANNKTYNVVNYSFNFLLAAGGKTWVCPSDVRTVRLIWSGAQTSGMAQSYVQKQYMRGLFQIATGDKDADAEERLIDEAPAAIAKTHRDRKASGKPLTSKLVALKFGSGQEQLPVDDSLEARIAEYLTGIDKSRRAQWRAANSESIEQLIALDKPLWLRIQKMVDNGVDNGVPA